MPMPSQAMPPTPVSSTQMMPTSSGLSGGIFGIDRSLTSESAMMFGAGEAAQSQIPIQQPGAQLSQQTQPPPAGSMPPIGPQLVQFQCLRRPNQGTEGRPILLRANHFKVSIPGGQIHYYNIDVQPDKCPRKVNRYQLIHIFTIIQITYLFP
jgi:hypothetical protein